MCTYPVQPICTFSCTSVFFINIYYPQYTVLHILSHCTSYTFYFIICSLFHSHLYLYIYSLVLCFIVLLLMLFSILLLLLLLLFCTFHWADLSRPTFHYWLYPVWLCMWQIIKNLEPWITHNIPQYCTSVNDLSNLHLYIGHTHSQFCLWSFFCSAYFYFITIVIHNYCIFS